MGTIKTVLFGKVDLDTIATALVMGVNPLEQAFLCVRGSASSEGLGDSSTLCIEVGGTGRVDENNFDHHGSSGSLGGVNLSACAQALERLARIVRYVDEVDRGIKLEMKMKSSLSLISLVSGMLICIRDPEDQMRKGLELFRLLLHSGIDPYESMEKILDLMPETREWNRAKREHDKKFEEVCAQAKWFFTANGIKLAAVETDWFGAPGALCGKGAEAVVVVNPRFERGGKQFKKYTVAVSRNCGLGLASVSSELNKLEEGWGGPAHGTIIGSPEGKDSGLDLDKVVAIVCAALEEQQPKLRAIT